VAAIAAIVGAVAAQAERLTIRISWVVTPGHMAPRIEGLGKREPAVFKHLGQSYVLEPLRSAISKWLPFRRARARSRSPTRISMSGS
jgi:hypothetical protein